MEGNASHDQPSGLDRVTISWRWISGASLVFAMCALAALAVVATVHNAEVLSTVALVLAILAFIIQIMVFAIQVWISLQQTLQSQQLFTETRALLGELRVSTEDTNMVLGQHFNKLLDRVITTTSETVEQVASEGTAIDVDDLRQRLDADLREAVDEARLEMPSKVGHVLDQGWRAQGRADSWLERGKMLRRWPDPTLAQTLVAEGLADLSPPAGRILTQLATDYLANYGAQPHTDGLFSQPDDPTFAELLAKEIVRPAKPPFGSTESDRNFYRLTTKGPYLNY
jgi:hypothetical protein